MNERALESASSVAPAAIRYPEQFSLSRLFLHVRALKKCEIHRPRGENKNWGPHTYLNAAVPIDVGLPQQRSRLAAGEVVAESPQDVHHLRGVDAVALVLVVESERSLDRLQERRSDLRGEESSTFFRLRYGLILLCARV